jgi:hypothetical protein
MMSKMSEIHAVVSDMIESGNSIDNICATLKLPMELVLPLWIDYENGFDDQWEDYLKDFEY